MPYVCINIWDFVTNRINNLSILDLCYLSPVILLNLKTNLVLFYKGKELIAFWHECTQTVLPVLHGTSNLRFHFLWLRNLTTVKHVLHSVNFISAFSCPGARLCQFSWKIESCARTCVNKPEGPGLQSLYIWKDRLDGKIHMKKELTL